MWAMSAEGHVSAGKTLEQTVVDEVSEELGVFLNKNNLKLEFKYFRGKTVFNNNWIENGINYVYLIKKDIPIEKIKIQDDEVSEVKWINLREYKKDIDNKNLQYRIYPEEFDWLFGLINGYPYRYRKCDIVPR